MVRVFDPEIRDLDGQSRKDGTGCPLIVLIRLLDPDVAVPDEDQHRSGFWIEIQRLANAEGQIFLAFGDVVSGKPSSASASMKSARLIVRPWSVGPSRMAVVVAMGDRGLRSSRCLRLNSTARRGSSAHASCGKPASSGGSGEQTARGFDDRRGSRGKEFLLLARGGVNLVAVAGVGRALLGEGFQGLGVDIAPRIRYVP